MPEPVSMEMKIALVLLAAGDSRRFRGNKLLYEFDGKPMYRYLTDELAAQEAGIFCRRLVVTQYEEIAAALKSCGYEIIRNRESILGISHSIHLGLAALSSGHDAGGEIDAVCFAVCDQPYLKGQTVVRFLRAWQQSGKGLGCVGAGERLGNPSVFSRPYFPQLMELTGDTGGKRIICRHMQDLFVFQADDRELQDIDAL